jgi:hypothetical protein
MIRAWIIRLGFIAAVLGFLTSLTLHLAPFGGYGSADLDSRWLLGLGSVYVALTFIAGVEAATTRPVWSFKAGTPWWVGMRRTLALRPLWVNLLNLLNILLGCYALGWAITGFNHPEYDPASLHSYSALWMGLSLSAVLSLGQYGLGWWNRWVAERGGAQP